MTLYLPFEGQPVGIDISAYIDGPDQRVVYPDTAHHLEARRSRHLNIRNDKIGFKEEIAGVSCDPVVGAHDLDAFAFQQVSYEIGQIPVVVDDQYFHNQPFLSRQGRISPCYRQSTAGTAIRQW